MFVVKEKIELEKMEGIDFYYAEVGKETHGKVSFRLWVQKDLVTFENNFPFIEFPCYNSKIVVSGSGNIMLKPYNDWNTYFIFLESGFRGGSSLEIKEGADSLVFLPFKNYHSQLGSLGVDFGYLLSSPASSKVVIYGARNGRLYGKPSEGIVVIENGKVYSYPGINYNQYKELKGGIEL